MNARKFVLVANCLLVFAMCATGLGGRAFAVQLPGAGNPWIYFADNGNLSVNRIRWDGSGLEVLVHTEYALQGITIDRIDGKLYWADNPQDGPSRLHRSDLSGANPEVLYEAIIPNQGETIGQLAIDEATRQIYWIDESQRRIRKMNLNGSGLTNVLSSSGSLGTALELDATSGKIYFGSGDFGNATSKLERINVDGTSREVIANAYAYSIFVDTINNRLLGGDIQQSFVFEVPLDSHQRHNLFPVTTPRDVQRYGNELLFSQVSTVSQSGQSGLYSRIVRSDLDGSNRVIVREVNRAIDPADHIAFYVYVPEPDACVLLLIAVAAFGARRPIGGRKGSFKE
jgi:hypothetical protein